MLEALGGTVASAITYAGTAVTDAIREGLGADVAAGNGAQLRVDLQALHDYFYKVTEVHRQFRQAFQPVLTKQNPYDTACVMTSEIHGVAQALQDTTTAALGTGDAMKGAFDAVDSALAHHLTAIAHTYIAYVHVDTQKSSELQAAGDTGAGAVAWGGGSTAAGAAKSGAAGVVV